ncbi:MAG: alpha/beta hydrolase [Planctomycetota bacterium]|nr:alpha/beta hydrolase [Planctomycetota bacterium]
MSAAQPIEVRTYGEGPGPVVLVHGGPGAPGYLAPLARRLAQHFSVFEPLQRAGGAEPLSVARHVADMAEALPAKVVLVGHSWGAMLALSFAAAHPERVMGLVLVGCGTYDPDSRAAYQAAMAERLGDELLLRVAELQADLDAAADDEAAQVFAELGWIASAAQRHDAVLSEDEVVAYDPRGYQETWRDVLRLQVEGIEPAAFERIRVPVLMLHGAEDPHPGRATFEVLRRHMPQLVYEEFSACGHEPWLERHAAEAFFASLVSWLGEHLTVPGPSVD